MKSWWKHQLKVDEIVKIVVKGEYHMYEYIRKEQELCEQQVYLLIIF